METQELEHQLHSWHLECLREMGFTRHQREALIEPVDRGEVELAELRGFFSRGWTVEQVFLAVG